MSQKASRQGKGKFSLCLKLLFQSEEKARIARNAILPELNAKHVRRSSASIGANGRVISITIKAQDAASTRATINSILNSFILAKSVAEV